LLECPIFPGPFDTLPDSFHRLEFSTHKKLILARCSFLSFLPWFTGCFAKGLVLIYCLRVLYENLQYVLMVLFASFLSPLTRLTRPGDVEGRPGYTRWNYEKNEFLSRPLSKYLGGCSLLLFASLQASWSAIFDRMSFLVLRVLVSGSFLP
jgi:hypothetical protein